MERQRSPLRIGILGTGAMATEHAKAALSLGCRISAGSARSPDSARWDVFRRIAPEARFLEPEALIHDPEVDAVIVTLPWNVTHTFLPLLFPSQKPMLIEKPLALDADTLTQAISQPGVILENKLIGFNRRYYRTVERVAERIRKGGLKAVSATISEEMQRHVRNHGMEIVPHVLAFSSAHTLDLLHFLLGPLQVADIVAHAEKEYPGARSYNGLLRATRGGIPVLLSLNVGDPSPAGIRFLFENGVTWVLAPLEGLSTYDRYEIIEPADKANIRQYKPHLCEEVREQADGYKPGFLRQMRAFVANDFGPGAKVEDSIALLALIDALKKVPDTT